LVLRGLSAAATLLVSLPFAMAAPETPASPSPSPTPELYSTKTLAELKKLQEAALSDDYAWRQVAHL
jgi:hypothetical protein